MSRNLPPVPWDVHVALQEVLATRHVPQNANFGLVWDRYPRLWSETTPPVPVKDEARRTAIAALCREFSNARDHVGSDAALRTHQQRFRAAVDAGGGRVLTLTSATPLAIGLGRKHPIENGLTLDATLGVPVIPGSAVKGLVRAWAKLCEADGTLTPGFTRRHLGEDPGSEAEGGIGSVVFYPALPATWPVLRPDVVTPHHGRYYQATDSDKRGSWETESPVPSYFLVVEPGIAWTFAIGPSLAYAADADAREVDALLDTMEGLLRDALQVLGVGAKTGVGYGGFEGDALVRLAQATQRVIEPRGAIFATAAATPAAASAVAELRRLAARFGLVWDDAMERPFALDADTDGHLVLHRHGATPHGGESARALLARASVDATVEAFMAFRRAHGRELRPTIVVSNFGLPMAPDDAMPVLSFGLPEKVTDPDFADAVADFEYALGGVVRACHASELRAVRLHPKCLPAIAVRTGMAFRHVTGLKVLCSQGDAFWDLDAPPQPVDVGPCLDRHTDPEPAEIHLVVSMTRNALPAYEAWRSAHATPAVRLHVDTTAAGPLHLGSGAEAAGWARAVWHVVTEAGVSKVRPMRLFTTCPNAFLVEFGRCINRAGRVLLMDYDSASNTYVTTFDVQD